ncbi:molybdopterin synthase sulfur carrier subunit [Candidatus Ishikawella capsulata]|uniref:Molybdopterin synthase sulfur carrier subunit n=1 Tax=Candidatus Ishikawaella capsulata Mpkobe TaxID=476281 RepID=C5WDB9_9ENTR|nr:molybdopterin synthase sulfur carrier subunit [Candidatus Ishikawaella capsulata]BAH83325.1 molybdopterin synthase small subunit [Candidatus Ishikawaella capsulata Mpkobe]
MIKIMFFAQIRELVGISQLFVENKYTDVESLRRSLINRGSQWAIALDTNTLLSSVNHTLVPMNYHLTDGDEVAFFPPVTGG